MVDVLAEELVGLDAVGVGPDPRHEADLDVGEGLGGRVGAQEGAVVAEGRGEDPPAAEGPPVISNINLVSLAEQQPVSGGC